MRKAMANAPAAKDGSSKLHNTLVYLRQHWQLYALFMLPAPVHSHGRYSDRLHGVQPDSRHPAQRMGRLRAFPAFPVIPGLHALSDEYPEAERVRSALGLPGADPAGFPAQPHPLEEHQAGIKQKIQLVLYMPNFISVIVLCGIVRILLAPTGMINMMLGTNTNFMTMPSAFRTIYIASGIWQGAGWASIIYTAALSNASKELKEAAVIDGANIIQQIKAVEWPAIKDTVLIQFIMSVGNIMSIGFEKAYALQTDLNLNASEIISTYVYKKGLLDGDYGFSTAVGLFNTVINVVLLISMNAIVKKMNDGKGV